jgi:hypothetical protein
MEVLEEMGVVETLASNERLQLALADNDEVVHVHVRPEAGTTGDVRSGATVIGVTKDRLADVIEHLIHKLGLKQVLLVPIGKWRKVFDAVAFGLADNAHWQEIDACASVSLNTRDPLLCEPGDFHTLRDLIAAILRDAETPEQGIMITSTKSPLMVELHPDGSVRISVGNPVLADEIIATFAS